MKENLAQSTNAFYFYLTNFIYAFLIRSYFIIIHGRGVGTMCKGKHIFDVMLDYKHYFS